MDGFYNSDARVLVVHCVDTEGPIGGNVRRYPDGTKEFMDNWTDIHKSLKEITSQEFRKDNVDSFGNYFTLNWFIMDFTGFKTNPKNRIQAYHDTYDNIKALNTTIDGFYWHYHQPPKDGVGDMWSEDWDSSNEHYNILGRRIIERQDFPEAFRAGGTIEDNKCSHWLEDNIMIDFSNRVSHESSPTDNIFDFNWYGAPDHWGYYHPSLDDFTKRGDMNRYIVRSVDLKSRLHTLQQWQVNEAFLIAKKENRPIILSYFSHDHRDMRAETRKSIEMIKKASNEHQIPFEWSNPLKSVQRCEKIKPKKVKIYIEKQEEKQGMIEYKISFSDKIYQKHPFVYVKSNDNKIIYHKLDLEWVPNAPYYLQKCYLKVNPNNIQKIGIGCTSMSGDMAVKIVSVV